ncbi:tetratricopeptide repeat protein [Capnocytophaga sp. Marseille-Q4570]|uniref:Tetratricopeptide repeat protein n=1 Tax=Capnocytophaga bilenii TaxID=2819369 RepID=A0ABS3PXV9_9FLAO|nr:tetratricopeptide repeat protein [Capnocytophaga bilenii]MBO1884174.1 tetratricopeptide repeat protein [Capnocytophaga bilenii]
MNEFLEFQSKWQLITMEEKMRIAMQTDSYNNQGVLAYNSGNIQKAIEYFEKALTIMPINDDALSNLVICYKRNENYDTIPLLWAKLYQINNSQILKEKIVAFSLLSDIIENYESEYDSGIAYLSRLLQTIKDIYNINTSDNEVFVVHNKINKPYNRDIITYTYMEYMFMTTQKIYKSTNNVPRSLLREARKDIINW